MSLAQALNAKPISTAVARIWASELAEIIRGVSKPVHIILFGSGADGSFKEGSDLDLLIVYPDLSEMKVARTKIRQAGSLSKRCPVDLVFVTHERFEKYRNLCGICHTASHEGLEL